MADNIDDTWLDELLTEVASEPSDYIDDNGFSSGVMQAIAHQEQKKFERMRRMVFVATAVIAAVVLANLTSTALIADSIQQLLSSFALVVLVPTAAVMALLMSAGVTMMLRD